MHPVVYAEEFAADLDGEVDYLRRHHEWGWIVTLHEDLRDIEGMLARFPESGRELAREGLEALRKLRLRRAPFYVWYSFDASVPNGAVTFLRLFHTRQRTPGSRLP